MICGANWTRGINGVPFSNCYRDCKPPKRRVGCHATCKDYLDATAEHRKEYQRVAKEIHAQHDADRVQFTPWRKGTGKQKKNDI